MREQATRFLGTLHDAQLAGASYDFDDAERFRWQYTPGPRGGVPLSEMDDRQREAAMALVDAALSESGARTARAIIGLEPVLKAVEERAGRADTARRDEGHYWFSVFGDPTGPGPWGWRVGGHHLCLHLTTVGERTSVTPLFFGANPARVPDGEHAGLRVLAPEEDLARALLAALGDGQRAAAVVSDTAPSDILTGNAVRAEVAAVPTGVGHADLDPAGRAAFERLVGHYLGRVADPPGVGRAGLERMTFAWAGPTEPGAGHYYAIRDDTFLVEYDNTQNGANHVHTVWRHRGRDWGEDLLAAHYAASH